MHPPALLLFLGQIYSFLFSWMLGFYKIMHVLIEDDAQNIFEKVTPKQFQTYVRHRKAFIHPKGKEFFIDMKHLRLLSMIPMQLSLKTTGTSIFEYSLN